MFTEQQKRPISRAEIIILFCAALAVMAAGIRPWFWLCATVGEFVLRHMGAK